MNSLEKLPMLIIIRISGTKRIRWGLFSYIPYKITIIIKLPWKMRLRR